MISNKKAANLAHKSF